MPIDPEFPENRHPVGRHPHVEKEHYQSVWGRGGTDVESSANKQVQMHTNLQEKNMFLNILGTMVTVERDSNVADGACIDACPVHNKKQYSLYYKQVL